MPSKLSVRVERMTPEGQGLARTPEGKVVFVPYAAPGDLAEVELTRSKDGWSQGRLSAVREPGPGRIEPPCPLHFKPGKPLACGGCDWQHLAAPVQLEAKRELVRDCLFRIARLREPAVEPVTPSPEPWRYRNKVLVPFGLDGDRVVAGFYAPGSHRIVDFEDCLVQPELSVRLTLAVKELARRMKWPIYDERMGRGWLRHLYVRVNRESRALAALVTRTPEFRGEEEFTGEIRSRFPEVVGLFQNVQPERTPVVLGPRWRRLWGADRLEERLGSLKLRVAPASFLQVNTPASELLYGLVTEFLTLDGWRPELALDLYSGVGSIALWIAPRAGRVLGVEESRPAVADAWENARLNGVRNARFLAGGVETQLAAVRRELANAAEGSAAAVLDPPRAGCEKAVLKALNAPSVRRIVYVSCNPATFARDAERLGKGRWRLKRVRPVDLFPQTSHVEVVGLFERCQALT